MENVRDMMQMKLTNLSIRLDAKLLSYFRDEIVCGITNSVYDTLYASFQAKVGDEIQENLKFDMKYNYSKP
jgi:hypothetical protein